MEYTELQEIILEPDPSRVMEGLRDTGYDFNTAIADLVDNSIAADASIIKVDVKMNPAGTVNIYIADNGCGMDMDGLKNAMRYGAAKRQDPSSLGKFGLGLKTASTAFCRCLSVISKGNNNQYNKVQWDLDEICKINKWKLAHPETNADEIDLLENVTGGNNGTLVVWEKVDRLMKSYVQDKARINAFNRLVESLNFHLSMVYQRFLDAENDSAKNVEIYLNDEKVMPWDPFCVKEPQTSSLAKENIIVDLGNGQTSSFYIEAWALPRKEEFSSQENYSKAEIKNDMEGFYVYRENRLIYHGDWLGTRTNDPHISLLRVNFSFDHTLDDAFNVDIKKSRIMLNDEIFDYLKRSFLPAPWREAENRYRIGKIQDIKGAATNAHAASNSNIASKEDSVKQSKVDIINETTGEVKVSNSQGTFDSIMKIIHCDHENECHIIPITNIESNMLWEPTIADGHHAVSINQSHPYYSKIYAQILKQPVLVQGLDALLWALSEAELSTYNNETKEHYEDMRIQVSKILKRLINDLPDPKFDDDNED